MFTTSEHARGLSSCYITWFHAIKDNISTLVKSCTAAEKKEEGGGGGIKGHLSRFRELQGLWNERGGKRLPGVSVLLYCATICLRKQTALAPNSHDQRAATPALNNRAAAARVKAPVVGCDSARFAKCRARRREARGEDQMSALEPATKIEARCQRSAVQLKVPSDVKFNWPTL